MRFLQVPPGLDALLLLLLWEVCVPFYTSTTSYLIAVASRKQQSRDFFQMFLVTNNPPSSDHRLHSSPSLSPSLFLYLSHSPGGSSAAKQEKRHSCSSLWGQRTDELGSNSNTSFPSLIAKHTGTLPRFLSH